MKIYILLAILLCAYADDVKETKNNSEPEINKDKRQTQDEFVPSHVQYRVARKQEQVAPVEEPNDEDKPYSQSDTEQYRPGQVFSLNTQELLELQPERKAPVASHHLLQQLYTNPQPEHKQNLQQIFYVDQQTGRQVSLQPSHAVIARPDYTSNGGEASVGAALSVSDGNARARDTYNHDLLALLRQSPVRQEEPRQQLYSQPQPTQHTQLAQQAPTIQSVAPQYQQVDRYITKPSKKIKLRHKAPVAAALTATAPQQYLIETTNVQQQPTQQQHSAQQLVQQQHSSQQQQLSIQQYSQQQHSQLEHQQTQQQAPLYRSAGQQHRVPQALRYLTYPEPSQVSQQVLYEHPEPEGIKIVPAPKLQPQQPPQPQQPAQSQQTRPQPNYRITYQNQPEAQPKQYRVIESPRPQQRSQDIRFPSQSVERPLTYLKRFPEYEKMRSVKIYDPIIPESLPSQPTQFIGEQQYYLRPMHRNNDHRARYEISPHVKAEQRMESPKPPQSSIFVSKSLAPRKQPRPQQQLREQSIRIEQPTQSQHQNLEQVNIEQHSLDDQRARLPPPRNNKAYTPEEFAALVEAGYSVTPVPVSAVNLHEAQSRSSLEPIVMYPKRFHRPLANRRNQYLPLRGDDAP